ncbi:MAG TPA: enoyl-CoA hydratase-related protein [Longimicrobiaceae bacterium]
MDASVLERREGAAAWITLNRPEKRNALSRGMIAALKSALSRADGDAEVRVIALEGAGSDFCAGADLAEMKAMLAAPVLENLEDADALGELLLQIRRMRKPVVAVVRGRALAGGCGLATACDLVIAAESARFGYPEVGIGFVPAMVMALLRRSVGEKRAFELICGGEPVDAAEAERLGLVNRVAPDDQLAAHAGELLARLADRSPSALQLCKRLLYQQDGMSVEAAVRSGAEINAIARATEDARAGIARFTGSSGESR